MSQQKLNEGTIQVCGAEETGEVRMRSFETVELRAPQPIDQCGPRDPQHSPGPWRYEDVLDDGAGNSGIVVMDANGVPVVEGGAECFTCVGWISSGMVQATAADARLIAAAPEMLAILRDVWEEFEASGGGEWPELSELLARIDVRAPG